MIRIDVPQMAYKTWAISVCIKDKDGNRDFLAEMEAEQDLKESLKQYEYSVDHPHVK